MPGFYSDFIFEKLFSPIHFLKDVREKAVFGFEQQLLNIPIQNYGEEYVKRYADRFSSC